MCVYIYIYRYIGDSCRMLSDDRDKWGHRKNVITCFDRGTFWALPFSLPLSSRNCQGVHFSPICQKP